MRRKAVNKKAKAAVQWLWEYRCVIGVIAIILVVAIFTIVCIYKVWNEPREGIVTSKEYQPAYESVTMKNTYDSKGHITGSYPVVQYHGEAYIITIKGTGRNGKETYGAYYVTPEEYERIQIGDYYRSGQ